jgi:hypothetical protein
LKSGPAPHRFWRWRWRCAARIDQRHLAENVIGLKGGEQAVAELDFDLPALDDIQLFAVSPSSRWFRRQVPHRDLGFGEKTEAETSSDMGLALPARYAAWTRSIAPYPQPESNVTSRHSSRRAPATESLLVQFELSNKPEI